MADDGATPPLPELPDDPVRSIFHRLSPDPSSLAVVSAVRRSWCRVVHDEENFLCSFRAAHSNVPPLLGFFSTDYNSTPFFTGTSTTGAMNLTLPSVLRVPAACCEDYCVYNCSHGRLLLHGVDDNELLVWDPLTGEKHFFWMPASDNVAVTYGAALICDGDHMNHGDCHSSQFRVVFVYSNLPFSWQPPMETYGCVYNSDTRSWGGPTTMGFGCYIDWKTSAVIGNAVYMMVDGYTALLEYNLETHSLRRTEMPGGLRGWNCVLVPSMHQSRWFGLVGVMGQFIVLVFKEMGSNGVPIWTLGQILRLENFVRVEFSTPHLITWSADDHEDTSKPWVIGSAEVPNTIFVQKELCVYMLNLDSLEHRRLLETANFTRIYPFSSFYTSAGKAIFSDAQQNQESNNVQPGGAIIALDEGVAADGVGDLTFKRCDMNDCTLCTPFCC